MGSKKKTGSGILIIIGWLLVIFLLSNCDSNVSSYQTDIVVSLVYKFAEQNILIHNIISKLSETYGLVFAIRKMAHLTVFCFLQIISFIVFRSRGTSVLKATIYSMGIVVIYAICDEIHQYYIPGRSCELRDVMIDSTGGLFGLLVSYIILLIKKTYLLIFQSIKKNKYVEIS